MFHVKQFPDGRNCSLWNIFISYPYLSRGHCPLDPCKRADTPFGIPIQICPNPRNGDSSKFRRRTGEITPFNKKSGNNFLFDKNMIKNKRVFHVKQFYLKGRLSS
jgi:hypothetical protein